ncbi:MAG TPA: HEAT repeat domain-containing protein, partial [Sandaracinaceae bacterium]
MIALRRAAAPLALALASLASAQPTEPVAGPPPDAWSLRLSGPRARADLRHPDPAVRIEAARTLGRSGEPHRAVAALADALAIEEDARVRSA